jgi:hypothetical protein
MIFKKPFIGELRTRTFFALFPVTIGNITVWLQTITIIEQFMEYGYDDVWRPIEFVNLKK